MVALSLTHWPRVLVHPVYCHIHQYLMCTYDDMYGREMVVLLTIGSVQSRIIVTLMCCISALIINLLMALTIHN